MKRIFSLIMMIAISLSFFGVLAQAARDIDDFSAEYKASKYYTQLKKVELTGNQREDLVNVALSQFMDVELIGKQGKELIAELIKPTYENEGYHEGNSLDDLGGGNKKGNDNYTEYNRWAEAKYGNKDGDWCAHFVSWCARQAGIPKSIINNSSSAVSDKFGTVWNGREIVKNNEGVITRTSIDYIPQAGDLIIFDFIDNGYNMNAPASSHGQHIGIVIGVDIEKGKVYAIEGNTGTENVKCRAWSLTSSEIKGYGVPNYASLPPKQTRTTSLNINAMTKSEENKSEGWSWDYDNKILILAGVNIVAGDKHSALIMGKGTIIFKGTNSILCTYENKKGTTVTSGICCAGDVTFEGKGNDASLIITGGNSKGSSYGLWGQLKNITIKSGNITATAGTSTGFSTAGIYSYDLTIEGGSLTAIGGNANMSSNGVYLYTHDLTIKKGGTLRAISASSAGNTSSLLATAAINVYRHTDKYGDIILPANATIKTPVNGGEIKLFGTEYPCLTIVDKTNPDKPAKEVIIEVK